MKKVTALAVITLCLSVLVISACHWGHRPPAPPGPKVPHVPKPPR